MAKYLDFNGLKRFKNKLVDIFQAKLVSGTNIKTINNTSILGSGDLSITVPTKTSDLNNDSGFINKDVNNLTYYTLAVNSGAYIDLSIDSSTYVITLSLKNSSGTVISSDTVDLPLESVVVNGSYDSTNKKIVLTLQSGSTIDIPVGDLISGLQTEITSSNKLSSDLVDDTNQVNKFVTSSEKTTWDAKQDALVSGTNIKTINNTSLLGSGDISIQTNWGDIGGTLSDQSDLNNALGNKQDTLVSGTNIKTINNTSILGSGDISISGAESVVYVTGTYTTQSSPFDISGLSKGVYVFEPLTSNVATYISYGCSTRGQPMTMNNPRILIVPEDIEPYDSTTYSSGDVLAFYYVLCSGSNTSVISYVTRITYDPSYIHHVGSDSTTYFEQSFVNLSGNQSVGGVKTFSSLPEIFSDITPTTNKQLTPKKYVDDSFYNIVADKYSSSSTYDVGDYVIYEGYLYVCNTTISTAEAWDSTHWTQTSVDENFGGGGTPTVPDIPVYDLSSYTWLAYSWTSGRYAPSGATFSLTTARAIYDCLMASISAGKKTFIAYTGVAEYPFIYPEVSTYSLYTNRTASSEVNFGFKLPIESPKVVNSAPLVVGYVSASFRVQYDANRDFVKIVNNPAPQWFYNNSAYAIQDLSGTFRYTIGTSTSDRYVPVYRMYVEDNFLSKVNTTSYTPTTNYNPATKKYVDDHSGWYNVSSDGTETKAGYQIDGQDVYVKRFVLNSVVNGSSVVHGLTNFTLVDYTAMADIDGVYRKLPYASGVFYVVDVTSTDISFYTNNSSYTSADLTVSIFYTKNV